jgi:hypothetical protein
MHAVYTPTVPFQFDAKVWDFKNFIMFPFTLNFRKIYLTGSISTVIWMNDDKPPFSKYIAHIYSLKLFSVKLLLTIFQRTSLQSLYSFLQYHYVAPLIWFHAKVRKRHSHWTHTDYGHCKGGWNIHKSAISLNDLWIENIFITHRSCNCRAWKGGTKNHIGSGRYCP